METAATVLLWMVVGFVGVMGLVILGMVIAAIWDN